MKKWAIAEIVLGVLIIAACICPSPASNIVLGALVVVFGGLIVKGK